MESRKTAGKIPEKRQGIRKTEPSEHGRTSEHSTEPFIRFERKIVRIFERTRFDETSASCSPKDEKELEELVEEYAKSW